MKIIAPFNSVEQLPFFSKLGITEVYGGFSGLSKVNENFNGRGGEASNFNGSQEITEAIKKCKELNIEFNLTFNAFVAVSNIEELRILISTIKSLNFQKIIVADFLFIKEFQGFDVTISTVSTVYNINHVRFALEENPNIKRVIMPRELSIREHILIIEEFPKIDFEILVLNDWCYRSNGMCSSYHYDSLPKGEEMVCQREKKVEHKTNTELTKKAQMLEKTEQRCRVCSMYFFKKYGDRMSFKVVGREMNQLHIKKDLLFTHHAIKNIDKFSELTSYIKANIGLHKKIYNRACEFQSCEYFRKYVEIIEHKSDVLDDAFTFIRGLIDIGKYQEAEQEYLSLQDQHPNHTGIQEGLESLQWAKNMYHNKESKGLKNM